MYLLTYKSLQEKHKMSSTSKDHSDIVVLRLEDFCAFEFDSPIGITITINGLLSCDS